VGSRCAAGFVDRDGNPCSQRAILAEVLAMRTILLNFMLKVGEGVPTSEACSK
jgi:hypothetical protein